MKKHAIRHPLLLQAIRQDRWSWLPTAKAFVVGAALVALAGRDALAGSLVLPFSGVHEPAADLLYKGRAVDSDDAATLARQGVDLGVLDPTSSDLWNTKGALPVTRPLSYPEDGGQVFFQSAMRSASGIARARVYTPGSPPQSFIVSASLSSHAAIARAALLKSLGYGVVAPRWYRKLTIRFDSLAYRDQFVDLIIKQTQTAQSRWVPDAEKDLPKDQPVVTLQDIVLEPGQIETPNFHWGAIPDYRTQGNSTLPAQRAFRALVVPLTLLDIPENPNVFPYTTAQIFSESAMFTHPYAENFASTTIDDARWISRRIGALKRETLEAAVRSAGYPDDVTALLIEKTVARRNQLLEVMGLKKEFPVLPYDAHLNVGAVVDGKLTRESYPGYALRFNYGDPSSPVRREEILRYLRIETIASVIAKATEKLNEAITVASASDVAQRHQKAVFEKLVREFNESIKSGKAPSSSQPVATWGGWISGFSVAANRNVVTGNYYGDESKAQLVDNLSVQAQLGYFAGVDNIPNVLPGVTGNVVLQRNYIHVRPVADMKAAIATDWKSLWQPRYMKDLAANLTQGTSTEAFKKLLDQLKQNEMLVITDTIAAGVQGRVTVPLVNLLGLAPLTENPILNLNSAARATAYRRTTILRTASGLQVYLQGVRSSAFDTGLDFYWWINVARYNHSERDGNAETRAYVLDRADEDGAPDRDRRLVRSIQALLQSNSAESLEEDFRPYRLNHSLEASVNRYDLLRWRWFSLEEGHLLKILPPGRVPGDPGTPYDPKDFERLFYNARIQRLNGVSDADLLSNVFKKITKGYSPIPGGMGSDPADSLLGHSQWTEVSTEAEITPSSTRGTSKALDGLKPPAPPVTLVERHWKGWILSRANLFEMFDSLETSMKPLDLGYPLINRDEFATMKQLQMYELSTALLVYKAGLDKITTKLLAPRLADAADWIIATEDAAEFKHWCESRRAYGAQEYYGSADMPVNYTARSGGKLVTIPCLKLWMYDLLKLRETYPGDSKDPATEQARIRWQNQLVYMLHRQLPLARLIQTLGKENIFFQVKVQGFKTNVENADTTAQYISHSVGSYQTDHGAGALRDLAAKTGIQVHELYARYLNEGY